MTTTTKTANKFKKGDRIFPNLAAHDAHLGGRRHTWRGALRGFTVDAAPGSENGDYTFSGSRHGREWVEQCFFGWVEHVQQLIAIASSDTDESTTKEAIEARNVLMDLGDELTRKVSAFREGFRRSAFEDLLAQWPEHQYRPSLYGNDEARALADIYDFVQKVRGVDVVAYRGSEARN